MLLAASLFALCYGIYGMIQWYKYMYALLFKKDFNDNEWNLP